MKSSLENLSFLDLKPPVANFREDVLTGLGKTPKSLSPKYFYDRVGSEIYDAITKTEEYYPTRTELKILEDFRKDIQKRLGPGLTVIELGCGSSEKIRALLEILMSPSGYVPIDISKAYLESMTNKLAADFSRLPIAAVCADFTGPLPVDEFAPADPARRLIFFPGSTIGNFIPKERDALLKRAREMAGKGGRFLVGLDLKKDPVVLKRAYNDQQGKTAAFNKNLLRRINKELGGDFDLEAFDHQAVYNQDVGRIEMRLVSQKPQAVRVGDVEFSFEKGEFIHTESSYKFHPEEFVQYALEAGFEEKAQWTDEKQFFTLRLFEGI